MLLLMAREMQERGDWRAIWRLAEELARLQGDQGKDRDLTEDTESGFRTLPPSINVESGLALNHTLNSERDRPMRLGRVFFDVRPIRRLRLPNVHLGIDDRHDLLRYRLR